MPGSQYGHSNRGYNLSNLRDVGGTSAKTHPGGFRAPLDWQREVRCSTSSDSMNACIHRNVSSSPVFRFANALYMALCGARALEGENYSSECSSPFQVDDVIKTYKNENVTSTKLRSAAVNNIVRFPPLLSPSTTPMRCPMASCIGVIHFNGTPLWVPWL